MGKGIEMTELLFAACLCWLALNAAVGVVLGVARAARDIRHYRREMKR